MKFILSALQFLYHVRIKGAPGVIIGMLGESIRS